MSYYNHRDYQLDWANRRAAQQAQARYTQAMNHQQREINRVKGDYIRSRVGSNFDPNHRSWENLHIAQAAQAPGEEMERAYNEKMAAMQNYMDSEMAQVQDRYADMHENRISSKNRSDEMAAALKAEQIAAAERMNQNDNKALGSMTQSLMSPAKVQAPNYQVPNTNLYNRNGQRIGGSYFR